MADGWITIGTQLSTDKFDRQILDLEKKMKKEEDKKIVIDTKLKGQEQELVEARKRTDELADAYQRLKTLQEQTRKTPVEFSEMQGLQNTYGTLEKIDSSFNKALSKQDAIEQKVEQTKLQYDGLNQKVSEYKSKIEGIKLQRHQADISKIKSGFNGIGNSLQNAVRSAGRLVLGIFAVRSAYMALRRASSDLATYDKQYAANLEYIRYALTQAIAPVLQWIVSMAAKLLQLINLILNSLFGINIFSRSSAESFNKMKAGASGAGKAVKQMKKELLGFDEINKLTDQSDTGTSGGAGGVGMPSFDLSEIDGEPPEWLKWILDNKDILIAALIGIASALILIKLGLEPLAALGIGLAIAGIVYAISEFLEYLKDPTWENFGGIITGIGIAITGIGIAIATLVGVTAGLPVIIAGIITLIVGLVIKNWETIKTTLQGGINWLTEQSGMIHEKFGEFIGGIYDLFVEVLQNSLNAIDTIFQGIRDIFDGFIMFFSGVFTGDWKKATEGLGKIFTGVLETISGFFYLTWNGIQTILSKIGQWIYDTVIKPIYEKHKWLFDTIASVFNLLIGVFKNIFSTIFSNIKIVLDNISQIFKALWNAIVTVFSPIGEFFKNKFTEARNKTKEAFSPIITFFNEMWNTITGKLREFGAKVGEVVSGAFKAVVNSVLGRIERMMNAPIRAINRLTDVINAVPGINLGYLSTFSFPRLKTGGIINMPNKGTMIGTSAIGGEAGREGVIPLTDQQAMSELGREIGKNVLINLTNITEMNGRVIGRELKQIRNEQEFAYNT